LVRGDVLDLVRQRHRHAPHHRRHREREIEESFVCAAGPVGGNVNKPATAVQFGFDVRCSPWLPDEVRSCLEKLAGPRLAQEMGVDVALRSQRAGRQIVSRA
jgi:ribosome-associated protein